MLCGFFIPVSDNFGDSITLNSLLSGSGANLFNIASIEGLLIGSVQSLINTAIAGFAMFMLAIVEIIIIIVITLSITSSSINNNTSEAGLIFKQIKILEELRTLKPNDKDIDKKIKILMTEAEEVLKKK